MDSPELDRAQTQAEETSEAGGIMGSAYRATTIGMVALVSLYAFESLALTTVMPTIAAELDGERLYAMAFTATIASAIVGMVVAGNLADRRGPRPVLAVGLSLFAAGLVLAAIAPTMVVLVASRVFQGVGAGMTTTALYVLLTLVFPQRLHAAVLAAFSAAWVVPSIVGPSLAGAVAQTIGWRWVFGISVLVLVAAAWLVARSLSSVRVPDAAEPWHVPRLVAAVALAAAVLTLNAAADAVGPAAVAAAVGAAVVIALALRLLTPRGTLLARPGVPADVLLRGLAAGAFTGAEIYLPRLLTQDYGFSPVGAGLSVTFTGLTWWAGAAVQGRWGERFELRRTVGSGFLVMAVVLGLLAFAVSLRAAPAVLIGVFAVAGLGIGTVYPRVTADALAGAPARETGFVSAALQVSESSGSAVAIATSALVFHAFAGVESYVGVYVLVAGFASLGLLLSGRLGPASQHPATTQPA